MISDDMVVVVWWMKERAGEEFSVWFGVSMFREKLPSSERETQEGMAGEVGGKVQ
jgi:hypothetical protein